MQSGLFLTADLYGVVSAPAPLAAEASRSACVTVELIGGTGSFMAAAATAGDGNCAFPRLLAGERRREVS